MTRRIRIHLGVGDILETAGAGLACYAVYRLAGLGWALLVAGVLLGVAGNLVYGQHRVSVSLPNRSDRQRLTHLATAPARALARRARRVR